VITLVDSCTGYVLTKCSRFSPTTGHIISLFRRVLNVFNACPETCRTDNGSIFVSVEMIAFLNSVHCQVQRSPVGASWCNGKVEIVHRIFHEQLLANSVSTDFPSFERTVSRIVQNTNTAHSSRQGCSAHELIFGYPAWIHPHIPLQFRPNRPAAVSPAREGGRALEASTATALTRLPQKGEIWLLRRAAFGERNLQKLSRPYRPVRIKSQISTKVYLVLLAGGAEKVVHLRHLKRLSSEIERSLAEPEMPPPLWGGGRVAGANPMGKFPDRSNS
jgi:hypothetical protein